MYIRTPRAYCWRDEAVTAAERPAAPATPPYAPAVPTRWARRPWPTKVGKLVAVRLVLGSAQVGVRAGGQLRWVSAATLLTEREARRWAANGF